ncbi:leucine-rich repeat domain-containing protein, partial [Candidatus Nomurabacteria bacterium]|nr:leucine-rich repeat domain-containing protein [Candidatus Nomurabacteria bacterium]
MNKTLSKILRRTVKIGLWTTGILLSLFILLCIISLLTQESRHFSDGDITYLLLPRDEATGERTVSLSRVKGITAEMEDFDIPSTASYKGKELRITHISRRAFSDCTNLTSITIPEGITYVGEVAFAGCTNLTNIRVAQGNKYYTSVDGVLFTIDMSSIMAYPAGKKEETYTLPNTVTDIVEGAFRSCSVLKNIIIPNAVTNIGERAFKGCESLTSITIPHGVTDIRESVFTDCSGLKDISIPDTVINIGGGAFAGCESLTSVTIPQGVTTIDWEAFYRCSGLTNVTIPESVNRIEERAFQECKNLKNVYFKGPPADSFIRAFYWKTILHYIEGTPGWTPPEWNG